MALNYYRIGRGRRLDDRLRKCEICGEETLAVLDHDHLTGLVRGNLCRQCNSWLGVFEANIRRSGDGHSRGKRKFKIWAGKHREVIANYLGQHKGFKYSDRYSHEGI